MKENEPKNRKRKEHEHEGPEAEEVRGTVLQYLFDPRGEVDGLLLDDGIFIKFTNADRTCSPQTEEAEGT